MCAGSTTDRRPERDGRPRRSGRGAVPSVHRRPDRVLQAVGHGDRLGLPIGPATGYGRPSPPVAAWTCPRRHQRDQRHGVPTRCPSRTSTDGSRTAVPAGTGITCETSYEQLEELVLPRVPDETNELSQVFIDAAQEAGFRFNPCFDDGDLDGCGWNRLSIHLGQRQSSYRAFVEPVLDRHEPAGSSPTPSSIGWT